MWLSTRTRPDICNAEKQWLDTALRLTCTLEGGTWYANICEKDEFVWDCYSERLGRGAKSAGVCGRRLRAYGGGQEVCIEGALVMCAGAFVSWCPRTHKCVTISARKGEYVTLADIVNEVLFGGGLGVFCHLVLR